MKFPCKNVQHFTLAHAHKPKFGLFCRAVPIFFLAPFLFVFLCFLILSIFYSVYAFYWPEMFWSKSMEKPKSFLCLLLSQENEKPIDLFLKKIYFSRQQQQLYFSIVECCLEAPSTLTRVNLKTPRKMFPVHIILGKFENATPALDSVFEKYCFRCFMKFERSLGRSSGLSLGHSTEEYTLQMGGRGDTHHF